MKTPFTVTVTPKWDPDRPRRYEALDLQRDVSIPDLNMTGLVSIRTPMGTRHFDPRMVDVEQEIPDANV